MALMTPFSLFLDFKSGSLEPHTTRVERGPSDVRDIFADAAAVKAALSDGDPLVYEVLRYDLPEEVGQLICFTPSSTQAGSGRASS